jgi:hypothetical protein
MALFCLSMPILIRDAWIAARTGWVLLPWLRQRLRDVQHRIHVMIAGVPLVTMALRHRRTYADAVAAAPDAPSKGGTLVQRLRSSPVEWSPSDARGAGRKPGSGSRRRPRIV